MEKKERGAGWLVVYSTGNPRVFGFYNYPDACKLIL